MTEANEITPSNQDEELEEAASIDVITPVVVELGKTKAKAVKRLKKGRGPLMDELFEVLDEVTETLGDELEGKTLVPVIMVYQKKKKRKRNRIVLPF